MRILGVHGVGNLRQGEPPGQAAANLASVWRRALPADLAPDLAMTYYADLLAPRGRPGSLDELAQDEAALAMAWLHLLGLPETVPAGSPGSRPRQGIAWLAERRGLDTLHLEWFVHRLFRDVGAYLRGPREAVHARFTAAFERHAPQVVIAHSLGSVVAYEALWADPSLRVDLLITLGSPLALPGAVFPRLRPAPVDGRGARPPGVGRWINLADRGDLVAIPPGGVARRFAGVERDEELNVHWADFHRAANYLATDTLAGALRDQA